MRLRVVLCVGGLLAGAGALNYLLVQHAAPDVAPKSLLVSLFAAVVAVLLTLWLTARYDAGIRLLTQGFKEVARGRRDVRFDAEREPLVSDLAHAVNQALATLEAPHDPSVGLVRVRRKAATTAAATPASAATPAPSQAQFEFPAVAPEAPPATAPPDAKPASAAPSSGSPSAAAATEDEDLPPLPPGPGSELSTVPPSGHDTEVASALPTGLPTVLPPTAEPAVAESPVGAAAAGGDAEQHAHFSETFEAYRKGVEQVETGAPVMDREEFLATLVSTQRTLVNQTGCRSVRFTVRIQAGQVQLLPRLVR